MTKKFDIKPCRGIAAPSEENHIRDRGKVRNKAMKKTKEIAEKEKYDSTFEGSILDIKEESQNG